jgi:Derlin-2/3
VKSKFELWRVLTPFCYAGPFDVSTMIGVYMLVQFSRQYETGGPFNTGAGGGTADYVFMMILGIIGTLVSYPLLLGFFSLPPLFNKNMVYYVLYTWSKRHPTAPANIWGFQMQAIYLPFAYLAFSVFIGNSYLDMIFGMAIGHIYYFLVDVVPGVYGKDVLTTPQFLMDYFGVGEYRPQQPAAAAAAAPRFGGIGGGGGDAGGGGGGGGGHVWGGGGNALGRN